MIGFEFQCHQGAYGTHLIAFDEMSGYGSIWPLRNWRADGGARSGNMLGSEMDPSPWWQQGFREDEGCGFNRFDRERVLIPMDRGFLSTRRRSCAAPRRPASDRMLREYHRADLRAWRRRS